MKETLFLQLNNETDWFQECLSEDGVDLSPNPAEWDVSAILTSKSQGESAFNGPIGELIEWVTQIRGSLFDLDTALILKGTSLVGLKVNIPSKQAKHVQQALPFMLEDLIAEDIDALHISPGTRKKDGLLPVNLINRRHFSNLITNISATGIRLTHIFGDIDCLPESEDEWLFLTNGRNMVISLSDKESLAIELDALPVLLNSLFTEDSAAPASIKVVISNDHMSENLENWLKTQFTSHLADVETEFEIQHIEQTSFSYLCSQASQKSNIINLMQGEFKPVSERKPSTFKWKPLASLAAVFALFFIGFQYTQAWKIEEQTAKVDQEARSLYKRYFPKDRNVTDIKRRMQAKLKAAEKANSGEGFLVLLAQVGEKLNEINRGSGASRLSPTRITFDEQQGDLKIDFIAGGFADLDALKAKLEAVDLSVEIARASQDGDKMKARMNIRSAS